MTQKTDYERIQNTFNAYDKDRATICVGSAALTLQFHKYGWDIQTNDVDVLASQEYINTLNKRLVTDLVEGKALADPYFMYNHMTTSGERKMSLLPQREYSDQLMKFQAFTTIRDDHHTASFSADLATVQTENDIQCLNARDVLFWKARLMRPTDQRSLSYALKHEQVRTELGDFALELDELLQHSVRTLEPIHGKDCGCYICM